MHHPPKTRQPHTINPRNTRVMLKTIPTAMLVAALSGCVAMPSMEMTIQGMYNTPSSGLSQFDGTKHIRVSNIFCGSVVFELYQDTPKSAKNIVLLKAGSNSITNIGEGESLLIKVDGKIHSFKSNDIITEHISTPLGYGISRDFSYKTYIVPEDFIRTAATSKSLLTKMHLLNNTYIEGRCSTSTLQEAKEQHKESNNGLDLEITQEHLDLGNQATAINGFRKFVEMMDTTSW